MSVTNVHPESHPKEPIHPIPPSTSIPEGLSIPQNLSTPHTPSIPQNPASPPTPLLRVSSLDSDGWVSSPALTRRSLLGRLAAAGPLAWFIAACGGGPTSDPANSSAPAPTTSSGVRPGGQSTTAVADVQPTDELVAESPTLAPTPACADDDDPTPAQTEGPFYTPDTPERATFLEDGITGTTLVITGRVLDTDCRPIAGALLDFWHSDDAGAYDNVGYRLRGHQFADAEGRWALQTIMPGVYTGRTRHIHVRVQPPGGAILTTQLYFPGEEANARDGIYIPELELSMAAEDPAGTLSGTFDFVVEAA